MTLIPRMHLTGGGQIINIKSHVASVQALIESRKDYHELAENLVKTIPTTNPSNFSLSIIAMLLPEETDRFDCADQVIDAIVSGKPIVRLSSSSDKNVFNRISGIFKRNLLT